MFPNYVDPKLTPQDILAQDWMIENNTPEHALAAIASINHFIFDLESKYALGTPERTTLFETRKALGKAEHLFKVQAGIRS